MLLTNMVRGTENDAVANQMISLWEHDAGTLQFWRASSNFVYLFERNGIRHFLRFVHEEDNTLANIKVELRFVQHLIAGGYPVAAPVLSSNGNWVETIRVADHGCYHGVVFEQAKGVDLSLDGMTDQQAEDWGKSLASLHVLSESYTPDVFSAADAAGATDAADPGNATGAADALGAAGATKHRSWLDALAFVTSVLQRHPHEKEALQELERVREQLAQLPARSEDVGVIHYDFEIDNVFYYAAESCYYVIDFDDAMIHWYAMDIVSAIADLMEQADGDAQRKIASFLIGYRSLRHLDEHGVHLFPLFQRFSDLYGFARTLRSVEDMDAHHLPEWAMQLKDKLLQACGRIRGRFLPSIALRPIDQHNWYACTELEVTEEQKRVFPVPSVYWLAEAAYCGYTPLALYAGEQLAGLAVYAVDPDDGSYWIMAFMIDHRFQHRRLGRSGMGQLISHIAGKHACEKIMLGHRPENVPASRLYASLGFIEVSRDEREVIRELKNELYALANQAGLN